MLVLQFLCFSLLAGPCLGFIWSRQPVALVNDSMLGGEDEAGRPAAIQFENMPNSICIYDQLELSVSFSTINSTDFLVCVQPAGGNHTFMRYMESFPLRREHSPGIGEIEDKSAVIKCLLNEDSCVPVVSTLSVYSGNEPYRFLVIFDQPTNMPELRDLAAVTAAFDISPPMTGESVGTWLAPDRLEITMDRTYFDAVMDAHKSGKSILLSPRLERQEGVLSSALSLRASTTGNIFVFGIFTSNRTLASKLHRVSVTECGDFLSIGNESAFSFRGMEDRIPSADSRELHLEGSYVDERLRVVPLPPMPLFRLAGVIPISGSDGLTIPHDVAPVMATGDWSLSMWLKLIEGPSGAHRSLFYKGDSTSSTGRTPSAWLEPDKNRMMIQVTTTAEAALTIGNFVDIPTFKWTLFTFVFRNDTARDPAVLNQMRREQTEEQLRSLVKDSDRGLEISGEPAELPLHASRSVMEESVEFVRSTIKKRYVLDVYQDAALDVSAVISAGVVGNDSPLQLFQDVSHDGPRGFAADVILWDSALTANDVKQLIRRGPPEESRYIDRVMSLLNISSADHKNWQEAEGYVGYPSVLRRLLKPDEQPQIDSLRRLTPLEDPVRYDAPSGALKGRSDDRETAGAESRYGDMAGSPQECGRDALASDSIDAEVDNSKKIDFQIPSFGDDADEIASELFTSRAVAASQSCSSFAERLLLYEQAARSGGKRYGENLYKWAMLTIFGVESPDAKCGVDAIQSWGFLGDKEEGLRAQRRGFRALVRSAATGYSKAIVVIATFLSSGSNAVAAFAERFGDLPPSDPDYSPFEVEFAKELRRYLVTCETARVAAVSSYKNNDKSDEFHAHRKLRPADSVFCFQYKYDSDGVLPREADPLLELAIGLLLVSAATGGSSSNPDAYMAMSYRYQHGVGVRKDLETCAYYTSFAAAASSTAFHQVGGMPLMETDRLNENTEKTVEIGNMGDDDEELQLVQVLAEEGNIPAIVTMGDLYYFGSRGLPRDQARALDYYTRAAVGQSTQGMCCAAAMHLKGEGTDVINGTRAVELYSRAAEMGSVKALNGLGYIYFNGMGGLEKNQTKAFEYFLNATSLDGDADSWYNSAYCMEYGFGVDPDLPRAAAFYKTASSKYGHFGSAYQLGNMYIQGRGVPRSVPSGLFYLNSINKMGPWTGWVRRGLDAYLERNFDHASMCYLHAGEISGIEVAHSNAAFLLQKQAVVQRPSIVRVIWNETAWYLQRLGPGFLTSSRNDSSALENANSSIPALTRGKKPFSELQVSSNMYHPTAVLRQLLLSAQFGNKDAIRLVGDLFYNGQYLPFDNRSGKHKAILWYSRASARGSGLSSFNLGFIHQFGIGTEVNIFLSEQYYQDALKRSQSTVVSASSDDINSRPMRFIARAMLWWVRSCRKYPWLKPVADTVDLVVRKFS